MVVHRWELTPGQVVFGVWQRELQTTELPNGPLASQLAGTGRFYSVHPSRYTMQMEEHSESFPDAKDYVILSWQVHLDMRRLSIHAAS